MDSTERGIAEELTEGQDAEAKTFKRFASEAQLVSTQGPEVLPEEGTNTRKQVAICGIFMQQHREDIATQQTARSKRVQELEDQLEKQSIRVARLMKAARNTEKCLRENGLLRDDQRLSDSSGSEME